MLDLIGQAPTFFIARDFGPLATALTVLAVAGLPLVLVAAGWVFGPRVGIVVSRLVVSLGVAALIIRTLSFVSGRVEVGIVAIGVSPLIGLFLADRLARSRLVQQLTWVLAFAPLAMLALVAAMPVGRELMRQPVPQQSPAGDAEPRTVVVIFDELPVASLIDGRGNIRDWYPNFQDLAGDALWFPDTVTVDPSTHRSIPSILSGLLPTDVGRRSATAPNHIDTLFTLSAWNSGIDVAEPVTNLCARPVCTEVGNDPLSWRTSALLAGDLLMVGVHAVVAEPVRDLLPPINASWGSYFSQMGTSWQLRVDRRDVATAAVQRLGSSEARLTVFHLLIPHAPWEYDGSGAHLTADIHASSELDGSDQTTLQRHLLQVQFADEILGEILSRLRSSGRYDETTIVVVADHGVSFSGMTDHGRDMTAATMGEVGSVPFFIKLTDQARAGEVDRYPAFTVDVLPTLAGATNLDVPWLTDGVDLLADVRPDPAGRATIGGIPPRDQAGTRAAAAAIDRLFPRGDLYGFVPPGSPDLIGGTVPGDAPRAPLVWEEVVDLASPDRVEPGAQTVVIKGWLSGSPELFPGVVVVIAGGEVVAMAETSGSVPSGFTAVVAGSRVGNEFEIGWVEHDGSVSIVPRS